MKRIGFLYDKLIDVDYLVECIKKAFKKKKKNSSIKRILSNPKKHAKRISQMIQQGLLPFVKERKLKLITDGKSRKPRVITTATNYEHIVHYAIIGLLEKRFVNASYKYTIASIPGRGDIYGKKALTRWIKSYKGRKLYVLKFDIKKFFDSVDRQILINKIRRIVKDEKFITIVKRVIYFDNSVTNRGIPIGYYTSQWFANFYLQSFDNFLKQDLHIRHIMRYQDDIVILSQNKRFLHKTLDTIKKYLYSNLVLSVKRNWQVFMLSSTFHTETIHGRPIDFMGYKFYPWKVTIRKSTLKSARRSAITFLKNRTVRNAKSVLAYLGRLQHAGTRHYVLRYITSLASKKALTTIVSDYDKRRALYGPQRRMNRRGPKTS